MAQGLGGPRGRGFQCVQGRTFCWTGHLEGAEMPGPRPREEPVAPQAEGSRLDPAGAPSAMCPRS